MAQREDLVQVSKACKLVILAMLFTAVVASVASAVVIRDPVKEWQEQLAQYEEYKAGYVRMHNLQDYQGYIYERNLADSFGFYQASRYMLPRDVYEAYYYPPLQGEAYATANRHYTTSLSQPSAVKYYAQSSNGRLSGYVKPDLNGVYFDHPGARTGIGALSASYYSNYYSYPGAVRYGGFASTGYGDIYYNTQLPELGGAPYYARMASQLSDGFYVVKNI
jgi:hypothetical protein